MVQIIALSASERLRLLQAVEDAGGGEREQERLAILRRFLASEGPWYTKVECLLSCFETNEFLFKLPCGTRSGDTGFYFVIDGHIVEFISLGIPYFGCEFSAQFFPAQLEYRRADVFARFAAVAMALDLCLDWNDSPGAPPVFVADNRTTPDTL